MFNRSEKENVSTSNVDSNMSNQESSMVHGRSEASIFNAQTVITGDNSKTGGSDKLNMHFKIDVPHLPGHLSSREIHAGLLMKQRESEYINLIDYRIYCGTFNVNGQSVGMTNLSSWLSQRDMPPPDIYSIGFQELDLSTNAFIFSESPREDEWLLHVQGSLHPDAIYKKVKLIRLVGIMLLIFIREPLYAQVKEVACESVGTGLLGMMGNKGGVAIRFRLHDTSLCFVNSHLAAHVEEYERRNQDFREISSRLCFHTYASDSDVLLSISDHDLVFWMGDLNYRLTDIDSNECRKFISSGNLLALQDYDQLRRQLALKKVFLDYIEGQINFLPTYKYNPGSDVFDTSEKYRAPAWCDRILFRGSNIQQLTYQSHSVIRLSDHKPVSAIYTAGIKQIDFILERKVREDVMKLLDQRENDYLPQVQLSHTELYFKNVKFIELQRQSIILTNTGQVLVCFEFINKLDQNSCCPPWLNIDPCRGQVSPGECIQLNFEVYMTKDTVPEFEYKDASNYEFSDILILHLEGGKDFFITLNGNYLSSSFGNSIENLVKTYRPIRCEANLNSSKFLDFEGYPLDVPKELWRMLDHLFKYGLLEEELFQHPGHHTDITKIIESLDCCSNMDNLPGSIHSLGECLVLFLESLPEPVIPYSCYASCLAADVNDFQSCQRVIADIPLQSHRNTFKYICSFLRELLVHSQHNKLEITFLATMFGSILLRAPRWRQSTFSKLDDNRRCSEFLYMFLINEYDD